MANNVYIGARYVPVFDGAWDSTKVYEPLTIVEYQNSSYTSKKAVPAGTLPTNTAYWALSGNYNGQIANLQTRVGDLETQNGNATLDTTAQTLSGAVNELKTQTDEITPIKNRVTIIENTHKCHLNSNSNIVCVGDSYGAGADKWPHRINTYVSPASLQNLCYSGGGIVGNAGSVGYYLTQLQGATNKSAVTDIIIAGGFNDAYPNTSTAMITEAAILTGFTAIKEYVAANFPKAKVYVGFIGYCALNGQNREYNIRRNCRAMKTYYENACAKLGFTYLNGVEYTLHAQALFDETNIVYDCIFHPNSTGCDWLAVNILKAIAGDKCNVSYEQIDTFTPESGITVAGKNATGNTVTYSIRERFEDGQSFLLFGEGCVFLRIEGSAFSSMVTKIGTLGSNNIIFPNYAGSTRITVPCAIEFTDSTQENQSCQMLIQGRDVYIVLNYAGGKTIRALAIFPQTITEPYDIL